MSLLEFLQVSLMVEFYSAEWCVIIYDIYFENQKGLLFFYWQSIRHKALTHNAKIVHFVIFGELF